MRILESSVTKKVRERQLDKDKLRFNGINITNKLPTAT